MAPQQFLRKIEAPEQGKMPKSWGREANGPTWNDEYPCEHRPSAVPDGGQGLWALVDIPAGIRLRRVSCADGTLIRIGSLAQLKATGWDVKDSVNYGIGHWKDPSSIYFLNPGTAMNHADKTREASVRYCHDEDGVLTQWTTKAVKKGEEMFINYNAAFGPCQWFDDLQKGFGQTPLSKLGELIDNEAKLPNPTTVTTKPSDPNNVKMPPFLLKYTPEAGQMPTPWGGEANGPTWNDKYPCEHRASAVLNGGRGCWALVDIPAGIRLRRVSVFDGTLLRMGSEAELRATGWDVDGPDGAVNYGIGHWKDPSAIFFLNPGTAMNHADKTRVASVKYVHDEVGVLTQWTTRAVKAGEEMFIDYGKAFGPCKWYDQLMNGHGYTPLSQLAAVIDPPQSKL